MTNSLLELLVSINSKKEEVKNLVKENRIEEATEAKAELVTLQNKYDLLKDLEDVPPENLQPVKTVAPAQKDAVHIFADAARHGFRNVLYENPESDGSAPNGGWTVPVDIQTRINELREAKTSLQDLVSVERVSTNSGARTYKVRSTQTGFSKVGEMGTIGEKNTPTFKRIEYSIAKYAGYFPVTNELLADSDANITGILTEWIANESRITRNREILAAVKPSTSSAIKAITSIDDIKAILNKTLGQAFKTTSVIITNDDGLNWLDSLKDENGRYLLNADPTDSARLTIRAGATVVPVKVVPNADMPTASSKVPFVIGDLKEGVKVFDRQAISILASNEASTTGYNAFEQDMVLFRAIERMDIKVIDDKAFVYGELTVSD